ncbi:hypothetical protein [Roseicyclus mahoneyensis]|uniref:Uncharacterized protein n=1 Tax=Roseicyclus mahoneyensis TaxID=164332 RepID=A0A316G1V3_9RHOB|nr:hypothetical protein [Roseicyclus mahoneyensis]PWK54901.1 hypothetical protein C7455_1228 [Roseicyclus mahoneyensis]
MANGRTVEIQPRRNVLRRSCKVRLSEDRVVQIRGSRVKELLLARLTQIQLDATYMRRPTLIIESLEGHRIAVTARPGEAGLDEFHSFCHAFLDRAGRFNPFLKFSLGPPLRTWVGARLALALSVAAFGWMAWTVVAGSGVSTLFVGAAILPTSLIFLAPVLQAARSEDVPLSAFSAALNKRP